MKINAEIAKSYRCPRWHNLPAIPLYMDQVVLVLEESLGSFAGQEKIVTATMVNNYVKQKVIAPPEKKKYGRSHIAELIMVSILKRVLSMSEIIVLKQTLTATLGMEDSYTLFCEKLESALCAAFTDTASPTFGTSTNDGPIGALDAALAALMGKLYVQEFVQAATARTTAKEAKAASAKSKK